jgi:hypothetical protein
MTAVDTRPIAGLAAQLRIDSITASTSAGSGHPTSSMSAADLMAVLLARHLRHDRANPQGPRNDHLICLCDGGVRVVCSRWSTSIDTRPSTPRVVSIQKCPRRRFSAGIGLL